ncbi:MAG TPA: lysophospholipid acyltransferase family protein [Candidatus Binatia bacterium]|nr:lysophospholipid acyltransferase family protein [Candidatus Binatia bacterium]
MKGTWVYRPGAFVASLIIWFLGGARIDGIERVPRSGAFLLVANHCSQLDPPLLGWATGYQVDRIVHFMAKDEMRRWPVIGWLADRAGVFFVRRGERDRAAQRLALDLLAEGRPVGVFPEGTRSRDGRMRAARPGAALLAMRSGVPIVPVGIAGTHRLFSGRLPRRSKVTFRIGEPFTLPHQPTGRLDREALTRGTERIVAEIAALLPPGQRPR